MVIVTLNEAGAEASAEAEIGVVVTTPTNTTVRAMATVMAIAKTTMVMITKPTKEFQKTQNHSPRGSRGYGESEDHTTSGEYTQNWGQNFKICLKMAMSNL